MNAIPERKKSSQTLLRTPFAINWAYTVEIKTFRRIVSRSSVNSKKGNQFKGVAPGGGVSDTDRRERAAGGLRF
jgi:hypothetical protein